MKLTTKILIPMAFALAGASASAGVFNIDYPTDQLRATGAAKAEHGAMVGIGSALKVRNNNSPVIAKNFGAEPPTRAEVLQQAREMPAHFRDSRYFQ